MTPHNISLSDAKLHLAKLAVPFSKLENDAWLEIRALREGKNGTSSLSQRFSPKNPSSVEHVLEFAARQNHQGYNIYITINPLNPVGSPFSPAKDDQVSAATFFFLDADDPGVAQQLLKDLKTKEDFVVVTGLIPHLRIHLYVELDKPHLDLVEWQKLLKTIIKAHNCDLKAQNPSRIMRLAGFVSHPTKNKIVKGYQPELIRIYQQGEPYDFL
tara:strand:- start:2458 stop:3099 length:642 start_codon:yes stop_codon:yes gene_type:complete